MSDKPKPLTAEELERERGYVRTGNTMAYAEIMSQGMLRLSGRGRGCSHPG